MSTKAIRRLVEYALEAWDGEGPDAEAARAQLAALRRAAYILGHASEFPSEEWLKASELIKVLGDEHAPSAEETLPAPTPLREPDPAQQAAFLPAVSYEGRPGACLACDGREFVLGSEAGRLGARLGAKPPEWSGTYHTDNLVALEREATAAGYVVEWTASSDPTWTFGTFTPKPEAPRLRVVSAERGGES